jgi:hypothetical protein
MEDYYKQLANVIDKYIILNMSTLSLAMRHSDGSDLGELFLQTFVYKMTKYMDGVNALEILCKQLYILDKLDENEKMKD